MIRTMPRPRMSDTELQNRQKTSGMFLPPIVKAAKELPTVPVEKGEEAVYKWLRKQLANTPGALTILDDVPIRAAAEAVVYYFRVKEGCKPYPLFTDDGKIHPAQQLLVKARTALKNALDNLGFNPKSRVGMRTSLIDGKHPSVKESEEVADLLNASEG